MASATVSGRRNKAIAARQAAKERRQMVFVIAALAILVLLLIWQVPHLLNRGGSSSSSSAAPVVPTATPETPTTAANPAPAAALKRALRQKPHDVFAGARMTVPPTTLGGVPNPPGLHDPFASAGSPEGQVAPAAATPVTASPLPSTIVIGKPGAGRVAVSGWIVILASIPTGQGQKAANAFAAAARQKDIGTVSVLNSSNRRPLRGGYWVVYTGPYANLAKVNAASGHVHASGFGTAYIRQLIVYKKKK